MTITKVITAVERRRRWSPKEKCQMVQETYAPGVSVSQIARKYDISPSMLFNWRRAMESGGLQGVGSNEELVPKSQLKEMERRIRELERMLGKKTMEAEILKEGYRIAQEKKLLLRQPLLERGNSESEQYRRLSKWQDQTLQYKLGGQQKGLSSIRKSMIPSY